MDQLKRLNEAGVKFIERLEILDREGSLDWDRAEYEAEVFSDMLAEEGLNPKTCQTYFMNLIEKGVEEVMNERIVA